MRRLPHLTIVILFSSASAATLFEEDFEKPGIWKKNIRGEGAAELVNGGETGKCLKVTSKGALVYYSLQLDPKVVRGKRLIIRARVKLENVVQGKKDYSTAKLHVGITVNKKTQHRAQRFVGTREWHDQVLVAPIPEDVEKAVLDLGIQNGSGTVWFDSLIVDDGAKEYQPVSINSAANTSYRDEKAGDGRGGFIDTGPLDLRNLRTADQRLGGIDFFVLPDNHNYGRTCIALRGDKRPDLPKTIQTVIPVDAKASKLFFLQAVALTENKTGLTCLTYTIRYADGKAAEVPMVQGKDIGNFENPKDLQDWKVAWTAKQAGKTLGLGVTIWENPRPDKRIRYLRLSTPGEGGVPIVVAISIGTDK